MKSKLRGLQDVNTAMKSGRRSRPQTQDGMLNELAQLKREKVRLTEERETWQKRIEHIDARLAKMAATEKLLQQAVAEEDIPCPAPVTEGAGRKERYNEMIIRY